MSAFEVPPAILMVDRCRKHQITQALISTHFVSLVNYTVKLPSNSPHRGFCRNPEDVSVSASDRACDCGLCERAPWRC